MENIEERNLKIPSQINNKSYVKYITHKKSKKEWQKFYMSGFSVFENYYVIRP